MKKTIAIILTACSLNLAVAQEPQKQANANAQPVKPNGPKPEILAQRHSQHLKKLLTLTDDQTKKTYDAMLARFNEIHAARQKYGPDGDKKAMHMEVKSARQKYVQTMSGILTPEQKAKWDEHRAKMKANRAKRKEYKEMPPTPPANGANGDIKKVTDEDDGFDD